MENDQIDDFESFQKAVDDMTAFRVVVSMDQGMDVVSSPLPRDVFEAIRDGVETFLEEGGAYAVWDKQDHNLVLCPRERVVHIRFALIIPRQQ